MTTEDSLTMLADAGATFTLCSHHGKAPIDADWPNHGHNLAEAIGHYRVGLNVGLLCGEPSAGLIALDCDQRADEFAKRYPALRSWCVWRRNAPTRAKFLVRCTGAASRCLAGNFEVLSTGRNAVLAGTHESGASIQIALRTPAPAELDADELASVWRDWTGTAYSRRERRQANGKPYAPIGSAGELWQLEQLLSALAPGRADDYGEWTSVGLAIKRTYGDAGYTSWANWSRQSGKYDPTECQRKWDDLKPDGRADVRSIWTRARQDGR